MVNRFNLGEKVLVRISKTNVINGIICEILQEELYSPFFYGIIFENKIIYHYDWDIEKLDLKKIKNIEMDPFEEEIWYL